MKRVFLILMFALAACADQGGAQSRQANVWLDEPVGRSSELPACPQRSKAWCTAGPQDVSCSCISERSFRAELNGLFR